MRRPRVAAAGSVTVIACDMGPPFRLDGWKLHLVEARPGRSLAQAGTGGLAYKRPMSTDGGADRRLAAHGA
jgi:hypothetical protein